MSNPNTQVQAEFQLPPVGTSRAGYNFDPSAERWQLDKDVSIPLEQCRELSAPTGQGFRLALARYAEEMSAKHAANMAHTFFRFRRDTGASTVTATSLINWRERLGDAFQWRLGGLRGFLLAWHGWGFPGISSEVVPLLNGWRIKGNEKGKAVTQEDPAKGPYTDLEVAAVLDWANQALAEQEIDLQSYAYLLTLAMTARRPGQIAALRGSDLIKKDVSGVVEYSVRFPRAKQRGQVFRESFRSLPVIEDLYLAMSAQHHVSVAEVECALGLSIPFLLQQKIPVFVNSSALDQIVDLATLREVVEGSAPDRLHVTTRKLDQKLEACEVRCTARSERTGERIQLSATRFRYTRGTNLRREGFGAEIIADLLDHSDVQNVKVYTENTVREAEIINSLVGRKLAPFAQACMGTLVDTERNAVRGDDPRSRVPNHRQDAVGTCGNYGFCASGYRACYTCHHFQPWVDGPHSDVLNELYTEKRRAIDAGCAREVISADDQLILAVEHCVALCESAKEPSKNDGKSYDDGSVIGHG